MKKYIYSSIVLAIILTAVFVYYVNGEQYVKIEDIHKNIQLFQNARITIQKVKDIGNEKYVLFTAANDNDNFVGYAVYVKKLLYNKYEYVSGAKTSFELGRQYVKINKSKNPHTLVVYGKNTNKNIAYYKVNINGELITEDISDSNVFLKIYKYDLTKNEEAQVTEVSVYDQFNNFIGTR